jgi:DNA-binding NtrC family response regulator
MLVLFQRILGKEGYEVVAVSSGEEALKQLETDWFDLVISDLRLPESDGLELLRRARALSRSLPFIVLTGYGTVDSAVAAMKDGAYDYLTKPVNNEELKLVVRKALELHRLTREVERLRDHVEIEKDFMNIVGKTEPMKALFRLVKLVAKSQSTILVQGESGTGKELIARGIHRHSPRRNRAFVTIDCGSLPETLLESELFGYVKGSFTGAIHNRKGLFQEAHGGTIFLDEIGDITPSFQSKLLRVMQEGEVRPLGGNKSFKTDGRVIAATNKDLKKLVDAGAFREDLYYRISVVPIQIPPLRERRADIPLLVEHFLRKYCAKNGFDTKRVSAEGLRLLTNNPWPGNVRELENVIERAVLLSPGSELELETLFPVQATGERSLVALQAEYLRILVDRMSQVTEEESLEALQLSTKTVVEALERERIVKATKKAKSNLSQAAKLLGISRATLYKKLRHYGITNRI